MIPAYWYSDVLLYLWQASVHSLVIAIIGMAWLRRRRLASGTARRQVLAVVLLLPLVTAALSLAAGDGFRHGSAWADSYRALVLPVAGGWHVYHLVLCVGGLVAGLTLWQELLPTVRRRAPRDPGEPPRELVRYALSLPGWEGCRVDLRATDYLLVSTGGLPGRPRLHLSRGAIRGLGRDEIRVVIRHEHAHWSGWRWPAAHLLFAARLVQLFNPVAFWAFREYIVELEIACDLDAVGDGDPRPLARALFEVYRGSDPGEFAARATVRRRVDVLLGRLENHDEALQTPLLAAVVLILLVLVPWVV